MLQATGRFRETANCASASAGCRKVEKWIADAGKIDGAKRKSVPSLPTLKSQLWLVQISDFLRDLRLELAFSVSEI